MPPKAKARGKAKAKARVRVPRGGPLRRPAGHRRPAAVGVEDAWNLGRVIPLREVSLAHLRAGTTLVLTEADYFGATVQVSGKIVRLEVTEEGTYLYMDLKGTQSEEVLRYVSAHPGQPFRVHVCPSDCSLHESGDAFLHGLKARALQDPDEAWTNNLVAGKAEVEVEGDEMRELRERSRRLGSQAPVGGGVPPGEKEEDHPEEDQNKKDTRKKKKKEGKREKSLLDGRHAVKASLKLPQTLFSGTALDEVERVRKRVLKRARKYVSKKRSRKSSSSSSEGSTSTSTTEENLEGMEGIFLEDSRARLIAERFPGALSYETLGSMRRSLLTSAGEEADSMGVRPVAIHYYRQILSKRTTGAQSRELLNLATAVDFLLRGRVCHALDVLTQRMKAQESVAQGAHWGVAQRMEIPISEHASLAAPSELSRAQKENYEDSRTRWLAQSGGKKGDSKGKGESNKGKKGDTPRDDRREEARKDKGKGFDKKDKK
eukprot:s2515_g12.t1